MNALKLFARLLLMVVMIPLGILLLLRVASLVYVGTHVDADVLSKAVAGVAVQTLFLAGLGWAYAKLGRGAAARQ